MRRSSRRFVDRLPQGANDKPAVRGLDKMKSHGNFITT